MAKTDEDWNRLISHMLAMAEDPRTPADEAEAARHRAMHIMTTKNIEEAVARGATTNVVDDPVTHMSFEIPPPFSDVQALFLAGVLETLGCKAVIVRQTKTTISYRGRKSTRRVGAATMRLYGRTSVVRRAIVLLRSLNIQVMAGLGGHAHRNKAFKRAYVIGFGQECQTRMTAIVGTATSEMSADDSNRYAVAILHDQELAEQAALADFPDMKARKVSVSSQTGLTAGRHDGRRADLNQPTVPDGGRIAIGSKPGGV